MIEKRQFADRLLKPKNCTRPPAKEETAYKILDVGCGSRPMGEVNVDFFASTFNPQTGDQINGEYMHVKDIKNFVISDATQLPFRDGSFDVVFSSHTIEHVVNPMQMFMELCRIAKRKVIIRCPHRRGSGAFMPFHLNYFDELWFKTAARQMGFKSYEFVTLYDYPLSNKLKKICPKRLQSSSAWRALRHFERVKLNAKVKIPFELETWIQKTSHSANADEIIFIVAYTSLEHYNAGFASLPNINSSEVIACPNPTLAPLPPIYNKLVRQHLQENVWFVFCSQDFVLKEGLQKKLRGKDTQAVYGPVGMLPGLTNPIGSTVSKNQTKIGKPLLKDTPVQTLADMCLIVHAEVFREGLRFDERFPIHFVAADFCLQAYTRGFNVIATPIDCQLQNSAISTDFSFGYSLERNKFRAKWRQFLPVRTCIDFVM